MKVLRIAVALAIIVLVPVLTATAARAQLTGPCTGTATINGTVYNPKTESSVVIPRAAEVHWRGTVTGSGKRVIEGKVYLKLPRPFGKIVVGDGSWNGPSSRYANNGVYIYDLPAVMVGPKFTVFGHHVEHGAVLCTGSIDVQIAGSRWRNPAFIASLLITVVAVINVSIVLRVRVRRI